jgi:hypothetical protein
MDDRMLRAGGEAKRRELLGLGGGAGSASGTPVIKKQLEDLSLKDRTKMTKEEEYKGKYGDLGQAENLLKAKKQHNTAKKI